MRDISTYSSTAYVFCILVLYISCEKPKGLPYYDKKLYDKMVIIPLNGCTSCSYGPISTIKNDLKDNSRTLFIITRILDRKVPSIVLGEEIINKINIVVDYENEFQKYPDLNQLYPVVYKQNTKEIIKIKTVEQWEKYRE